ncbi:S1 family peptidase [Halobaculum magnesiiphilum]
MERLLRTTTPIRYPTYNRSESHSTGFFFRTNRELYLITARHCLFESDRGGVRFRPEEIAIRLRDKKDHRESRTMRIPLYDESGDRNWIEPYHYDVDIAALPLEISLRETGNTSFGTSRLSKAYEAKNVAVPGDSAIVAGYPVVNAGSYSPILRNALISSALDVDYDKQPYFLIDSQLHEGTSGSPVLVRKTDRNDNIAFHVIGVHSGQHDVSVPGGENLNRVWFLKHLRIRLNDFEPDLTDLF